MTFHGRRWIWDIHSLIHPSSTPFFSPSSTQTCPTSLLFSARAIQELFSFCCSVDDCAAEEPRTAKRFKQRPCYRRKIYILSHSRNQAPPSPSGPSPDPWISTVESRGEIARSPFSDVFCELCSRSVRSLAVLRVRWLGSTFECSDCFLIELSIPPRQFFSGQLATP